jgi:hypothetical protein
MNLVALLIAPLVVEQADNLGVRISVGVVAALIVAAAIWISKSRKSELMVERTAETDVAEKVDAAT